MQENPDDALWLQVRQLTADVARLRAADALRGCVHDYARALDRLDRTLLAAQFWPEAEIDYGRIYRGSVEGFLDVALQFQGAMRATHHLVGNVRTAVDGDRATAESYVQAHHVLVAGDERIELVVGARYLDRFEQREGCWRIAFRSEVLDWGRRVAIAERWFDDDEQMAKGRRDREDLSYRFLGGA